MRTLIKIGLFTHLSILFYRHNSKLKPDVWQLLTDPITCFQKKFFNINRWNHTDTMLSHKQVNQILKSVIFPELQSFRSNDKKFNTSILLTFITLEVSYNVTMYLFFKYIIFYCIDCITRIQINLILLLNY